MPCHASPCLAAAEPEPEPDVQVEASEKSSGKKETITIKAEKGRLSDEEIERMVKEAEDFKEQDEAYAAKVVP